MDEGALTLGSSIYLHDSEIFPSMSLGSRICPGRYFAEGSVYAVVTGILHTMHIEAPRDARGTPINLKDTVKMTHGVIS